MPKLADKIKEEKAREEKSAVKGKKPVIETEAKEPLEKPERKEGAEEKPSKPFSLEMMEEETEEDSPAPAKQASEENLVETKKEEEKVEDSEVKKEEGDSSDLKAAAPKVASDIGTNFVSGDSSGGLKAIFNKKTLFVVLVVILGLGLVGGGIFVYQKAMKKEGVTTAEPESSGKAVEEAPAESEASEETEETPSPEPSPEVELKREDLKVQVLNGSGAPGVAGVAKEFLEGLGYKDVDTDNAGSYDYDETEIAVKEDRKDYLEMLEKDLEEKYTLAEDVGTLAEDSDFDAVVTLGAE